MKTLLAYAINFLAISSTCVSFYWENAIVSDVTGSESAKNYDVDVAACGRAFDGIGAISGGGATSKLLKNYPEKLRNEILDYLFKPGFGASLQVLKIEIGGDSQSSDGAEASHMHTETDENYSRGYEWWLMMEAKKRNPNMKFYGLPWTFPGWLGGGQFTPYYNRTKLVTYIMNWINGAKVHHGIDIHYIGVWNERPYDIQYIKMLKQALMSSAYSHVRTVAGDAMSWQIVKDYVNSTALQQSLDIIGYHYPGSYSPPEAQSLPIPLFASEEYSAYNDIHGGGCWARVLNEAYVNGKFTGIIAWNLIASYYNNLPFSRMGLMTANQPWSGYYDVSSPIWMSAHHTQFTAIGWKYLAHNAGSGNLTGNGTYVTYVSPDRQHVTMVIETMDPSTAPCFYHMPKYTISDVQTATFRLHNELTPITSLNAWYTKFNFDGSPSTFFQSVSPVKVINGSFTLELHKNEVITLTTVSGGQHGQYAAPPSPALFPVPYHDNFEGYEEHAEAYNLVQQAGVWEVHRTNDSTHGDVIRQVVTQPPIDTCRPRRMPHPVAIIGNFNWSDVTVQVDVNLESSDTGASGAFLGARARCGGCDIQYANGVVCWFYANSTVRLTANFSQSAVIEETSHPIERGVWYSIGLDITNHTVSCSLDNKAVIKASVLEYSSPNGFVALGVTNFGSALFDNLSIPAATVCSKPQGSNGRCDVF